METTTVRSLVIALLLPCAALAQGLQDTSQGPTYFAGAKVGYFQPTSDYKGSAFGGLELGIFPGWLDHHLALALEGDLYRPTLSSSVTSAQLTYGGTTASGAFFQQDRELSLMLSAEYFLSPVWQSLTPYAGVGLGVYGHQVKTTAFGLTNTEKETSLGAQALVGAQYGVGPGAAFVELHYQWSKLDFLSTGSAAVGGLLAFSLGYRVGF